MSVDIKAISETIAEKSRFVERLFNEVEKVIVGQRAMVEGMLTAILCGGHILIEGVPGLAKTLSIQTLAHAVQLGFKRIQFTPDLMPADLTGAEVYNAKEAVFSTRKGPLFSNIILADEINRAPAKAQSALLEAMQERQVTIGSETFRLPDPFIVLATQNPIEQEGTYPLPEAQVDRFMLKLIVTYPTPEEEMSIVKRNSSGVSQTVAPVVTPQEIMEAKGAMDLIYIDDKIIQYIINIVGATRRPSDFGLNLDRLIQYGASPRASIYLTRLAKANAFLRHRGYVLPDDVKKAGHDVLRHRVIPTYEADAENVTPDDIISKIFDAVEVP